VYDIVGVVHADNVVAVADNGIAVVDAIVTDPGSVNDRPDVPT